MCQIITAILDGEPIAGKCREPWESVRQRLAALLPRQDNDRVTAEWLISLGGRRTRKYGAYDSPDDIEFDRGYFVPRSDGYWAYCWLVDGGQFPVIRRFDSRRTVYLLNELFGLWSTN